MLKNTAELQALWNPDTPIEDVITRGAFCRDFAEEGEDPITDATYTRYLGQIFNKSGVLEKAVEDWEKKLKADKTLANCKIHFTDANTHRLTKLAKDSKDVLAANEATTKPKEETTNLKAMIADEVAKATKDATKNASKGTNKNQYNNPANDLKGLFYCWSHGVCGHKGINCTFPKEGHNKKATIFKRMGGANTIHMTKAQCEQENCTPNTTTN